MRAVAAAMVAMLVAGIVWLFSADLGFLKPRIEQWVSNKTGRELRIGGPLELRLGGTTTVRAEDVQFENAAWAGEDAMVEIGTLELAIDLWSALGDSFIVELVKLDDVQIRLASAESAEVNWRLEGMPDAEPSGRGEPAGFGFLLRKLDVDRLALSYESPRRSEPLLIEIQTLDQEHQPNDFLELSLLGAVGGRDVDIDGRFGTWSALLAGRNVEFDVDGRLDTISVSSDGVIDALGRPARPSLRFSINGPDIDDLTRMFGMGDEADGAIDLAGSLIPGDDGPLVLSVGGRLGEVEIEAEGTASDLQDLVEMDLDLQAAGPSLGRVLRWFGVPEVRDAPFAIDVDARRSGPLLLVEEARMTLGESVFDLTASLPQFPGLNDGRIKLDVTGPAIEQLRHLLRLPGVATGPFSLSFALDVSAAGEQSIRVAAQSNLFTLEAGGPLGPPPEHFGSRLSFRLRADALSPLGDAWGIANLPERPLEIAGALAYTARGVETAEPIVVEAAGVVARGEGVVVPRGGLVGTDVTFSLAGPNLKTVAEWFGAGAQVPARAYAVDGRLEVLDSGYRLHADDARIGSSTVAIDALLGTPPSGTEVRFSAMGPAFEEIVVAVGRFDVAPGPYELSGRIELGRGLLELSDIELNRARGDLTADLTLALPLSERRATFDVRGRGADVRNLLQSIEGFEALPQPFELAAVGEWRGGELACERCDVEIGDASVTASGTLNLGEGASSSRFSVRGNVPSLARLGTIDGRRMRDQPLSWQGRVSGGAGLLELDDFVASLGDSEVNGRVRIAFGDVPDVQVELRAPSLVLVPLLEERTEVEEPEQGFADGRLIPDVRIPLDAMRKINASAIVDIGRLERDGLELWDVRVRSELRDGSLTVSDSGFRARSGRLDASARLGHTGESASASLELTARNLALGLSESNQDLATKTDLDIKLESRGDGLRSLLGNADGAVLVNIRGGKISNSRLMGLFFGDIVDEVIPVINPFITADEFTSLECVVVPYRIDAGKAVSTPHSLFATGKIRAASKDWIDLKSEKIEMNVRTTPKKSLGISAGEIVNPYVKVVGTLAAPRVAVDEKGVLITGGAAVATGGLSILAKAAWDRLSKTADPCSDVSVQALELLGERLPRRSAADPDDAAP